MIKPRQTVEQLRAYLPPLEGRREQIRLDFNENTSGFPATYAQEPATLYTAYPEYTAFLKQLSAAWEVPEDHLLLTNGSDEALFVTSFTFIEPGQDAALTMMPTFSLIPHYLKLVGSRLIEVPYTADFQYDVPAIEQRLNEAAIKLVVLASPDNPIGATVPIETIRRWCAGYPETLFVIDEAYAEYAGITALPLIHEFNNILITRTFSKAWGMAGLRLGVILGSPLLLEVLQRVRSPYSVNALAVQTASQLLLKQTEVHQGAQATMRLKAKVLEVVQSRGYRIVEGKANFFLMGVGLDAAGFCNFFREQGILLRDQSGRPMLQGWVRVSMGTEPEMERFLSVLDELRQKRILLFDMDGTLVDTRQSFDRTIAHVVEKHSGQPLVSGELSTLRAQGGFNDDWDAIVELLRQRGHQKTYTEIAQEASALYLTLALAAETWLIPQDVLMTLRQRYRLGVATGRFRPEFDPIWKERFEPLFEVVACQDDQLGCAKKPAPELLKFALSSMNAEGGIYIGNSVDDMQAAKAAGLLAVGVTTTNDIETLRQAGADFVIESLSKLEGYFMP